MASAPHPTKPPNNANAFLIRFPFIHVRPPSGDGPFDNGFIGVIQNDGFHRFEDFGVYSGLDAFIRVFHCRQSDGIHWDILSPDSARKNVLVYHCRSNRRVEDDIFGERRWKLDSEESLFRIVRAIRFERERPRPDDGFWAGQIKGQIVLNGLDLVIRFRRRFRCLRRSRCAR